MGNIIIEMQGTKDNKEGTVKIIEKENGTADLIFEDLEGEKTLYTNIYPISYSDSNSKPVENCEIRFDFDKLF